jgi:hypothetical protein
VVREVLVDGGGVANGAQPTPGDHHRLCLPTDLAGGALPEVLDDLGALVEVGQVRLDGPSRRERDPALLDPPHGRRGRR